MKIKLFILITLIASLISAFPVPAADKECQEALRRVAELHTDISLLNLINGLYLSADQIQKLLPILKETQEQKEVYEAKLLEQSKRTELAFQALKDQLVQNKGPAQEIAQNAVQENHKLKELVEMAKSAAVNLEKQVKEVLNENQLILIEDFVPCLIPPKDPQKSARIGQAPDEASGLEKLFERVRRLPPRIYENNRDRTLEAALQKVKKKRVNLPKEVEKMLKDKLLEILDQVPVLSDTDFAIQKKQWVREFLDLRKQLKPKPVAKEGELGPVGRFFLNPRLIPILEKRLADLS